MGMSDILVTGGAGFIATNLIKRLVEQGNSVRASWHNKKPQYEHPLVEYVKCDLLQPSSCDQIVSGIKYLYHCAANTSGAAIIQNTPLAHVTPNVLMNTMLLDSAYRAGVEKFLFLSSNTVYPVTDYPVKESEATGDLFEKYFCVASMKRFTETLCEMYATKIRKTMKTIVVRPGNVYGEYDDFEWETAHVIPSLIRKIVERHSPVEVWGDGKDIKDFIYVSDMVDGIVLAMNGLDGFDPINIAAGSSHSLREVIDNIIKIDGYDNCELRFDESKPTMIPKRLIDISKAQKLLKFQPKFSLYDGLTNTIQWYRRNYVQ